MSGSFDLTGKQICQTYPRLLQIDTGSMTVYDGLGNIVPISGSAGSSGTSGISGSSGTSGVDGTFFGSSGTSGTSGIDGSSGTSGTSGSSGTSGTSGSSGTSGISGSSGTSGIDGSSGTSGINGTSGSSGTSSTSGTSGSSGTSGTSGTAGTSGLTFDTASYAIFAETASYLSGSTAGLWTASLDGQYISRYGNVKITGSLDVIGNAVIDGILYATEKHFYINHPTKEGKKLIYGTLEGPENSVYVRGTLKGNNIISLPDYWINLVDENTITVSLTPIGKYQKLVVEKIENNSIFIKEDSKIFKSDIHCYYLIIAERKDIEKLQIER